MDILNGLGLICTIAGVSLISILSIFKKVILYRTYKKQFRITKNVKKICTKRYIEPVYVVKTEPLKGSLTRNIKKLVCKLDPKMIFILGSIGSGKTTIINRFISKYALYFWLRNKIIVHKLGMECDDLVKMTEEIDNKENTILIIDGLDEAFVYRENDPNILDNLSRRVQQFYKVIITMNPAFYHGNTTDFEGFYIRNAEENKLFPMTIYLRPFTQEKIKRFIDKNIKAPKLKKQVFLHKAMENTAFYSSPLMLSFIVFFDSHKGNFDSYFDLLEYILRMGMMYDKKKYSKGIQFEQAQIEIRNIMRSISKQYLNGKYAKVKRNIRVRNVLLDYDEQRKEYRFQNAIFLYHSIVRNFYSKIPNNDRVIRFINLNEDFRKIYFEKIYNRHSQFLAQNRCILFDKDMPHLAINCSKPLSMRQIIGLTKSFLNYDVQFGDMILTAPNASKLLNKLILNRSLELQEFSVSEQQLEWWAEVPIDKLNISNMRSENILIPEAWLDLRALTANHVSLKYIRFLEKLKKLEYLDFSNINLQQVVDLNFRFSLPDGISVDLSNCNITNDYIPEFVLHTNFKDIYLDYNYITVSDFIYKISFTFLNVSNNPIKDLEDVICKKNIVCNFYFEDEEIEQYLCGKNEFLTYHQALKIKEINISQMDVSSLSGIDSLPYLETITMNTFQSSKIDDIFQYSSLKSLKMKTYMVNQLIDIPIIYEALMHFLVGKKQDGYEDVYKDILYLDHIMSLAKCLVEDHYPSKRNEIFIIGIKKMMHFMHTELSFFYRRIIDAFHYAAKYWHENEYDCLDRDELECLEVYDTWLRCNDLANKDYEKKLVEICIILDIKLLSPKELDISMLPYFKNMQDMYTKYIKHSPDDMGKEVSKRIGKKIDVMYFWE